jgi:hypothetical protein
MAVIDPARPVTAGSNQSNASVDSSKQEENIPQSLAADIAYAEEDIGMPFNAASVEEKQLPQQDGGAQAWLFLFGASVVEITAWGKRTLSRTTSWNVVITRDILGFPYCYGVFRAYFFTHAPFQGIAIISVGGMLANVMILLIQSSSCGLTSNRACSKSRCPS